MRAIYFVEVKGVKYYKCDTFWSKSSKHTNAKIHNDTKHDQDRFFESLVYGFKPYNVEELNEEEYTRFKNYEGSLYGYQTILDPETTDTRFSLKEDVKLSEPIYLRKIDSISKRGEVDSYDYKTVIERENKINKIIDEN